MVERVRNSGNTRSGVQPKGLESPVVVRVIESSGPPGTQNRGRSSARAPDHHRRSADAARKARTREAGPAEGRACRAFVRCRRTVCPPPTCSLEARNVASQAVGPRLEGRATQRAGMGVDSPLQARTGPKSAPDSSERTRMFGRAQASMGASLPRSRPHRQRSPAPPAPPGPRNPARVARWPRPCCTGRSCDPAAEGWPGFSSDQLEGIFCGLGAAEARTCGWRKSELEHHNNQGNPGLLEPGGEPGGQNSGFCQALLWAAEDQKSAATCSADGKRQKLNELDRPDGGSTGARTSQ